MSMPPRKSRCAREPPKGMISRWGSRELESRLSVALTSPCQVAALFFQILFSLPRFYTANDSNLEDLFGLSAWIISRGVRFNEALDSESSDVFGGGSPWWAGDDLIFGPDEEGEQLWRVGHFDPTTANLQLRAISHAIRHKNSAEDKIQTVCCAARRGGARAGGRQPDNNMPIVAGGAVPFCARFNSQFFRCLARAQSRSRVAIFTLTATQSCEHRPSAFA
jgi:hypothetical protein